MESHSTSEKSSATRRGFIGQLSWMTAAGAAISARPVFSKGTAPFNQQRRAQEAFNLRRDLALYHRDQPNISLATNGDDERYSSKFASYSKGLPHNNFGEVDLNAYAAMIQAIESGRPADFEAIPLGGKVKLANPQGGLCFDMLGSDSHQVEIAVPPAFASAEAAGEIGELYWQALTRDVLFSAFAIDPTVNQAIADLNRFSDFRGPKQGNRVTAGSLFRGDTPGDLNGPYVSQFLFLPIPYGATSVPQQYKVPIAGNDFVTTYTDWLANQRGTPATATNTIDPTPRYIRCPRDLTQFVHVDFSFMAYLNACLILQGMGAGAISPANPYNSSQNQSGFTTFGPPEALELVTLACNVSLRAAWSQKFMVHRRLRPEVFAGRIHNNLTAGTAYPIHSDILNSQALAAVSSANHSYLLPQAYPEASPTHPSYPAGHAVLSGACATMLKAFFNESFVIPKPVVASDDGLSLIPYTGSSLTVGDELNKLAANIAISRNAAGVHYRSDGIEGIKFGEAVAIAMLHDIAATVNENFQGFSFTKFDGTKITISPN